MFLVIIHSWLPNRQNTTTDDTALSIQNLRGKQSHFACPLMFVNTIQYYAFIDVFADFSVTPLNGSDKRLSTVVAGEPAVNHV